MILVLMIQFIYIRREYREQITWENLEKKANVTSRFIKTHAESIKESASNAASETIEKIR